MLVPFGSEPSEWKPAKRGQNNAEKRRIGTVLIGVAADISMFMSNLTYKLNHLFWLLTSMNAPKVLIDCQSNSAKKTRNSQNNTRTFLIRQRNQHLKLNMNLTNLNNQSLVIDPSSPIQLILCYADKKKDLKLIKKVSFHQILQTIKEESEGTRSKSLHEFKHQG